MKIIVTNLRILGLNRNSFSNFHSGCSNNVVSNDRSMSRSLMHRIIVPIVKPDPQWSGSGGMLQTHAQIRQIIPMPRTTFIRGNWNCLRLTRCYMNTDSKAIISHMFRGAAVRANRRAGTTCSRRSRFTDYTLDTRSQISSFRCNTRKTTRAKLTRAGADYFKADQCRGECDIIERRATL